MYLLYYARLMPLTTPYAYVQDEQARRELRQAICASHKYINRETKMKIPTFAKMRNTRDMLIMSVPKDVWFTHHVCKLDGMTSYTFNSAMRRLPREFVGCDNTGDMPKFFIASKDTNKLRSEVQPKDKPTKQKIEPHNLTIEDTLHNLFENA